MTGLYFHIPFCARKCPYCDFYSVSYTRETAEAYVGAILRNIRAYAVSDTVDSVYFGGGTPSLLSAAHIGKIIELCAARYHFSEDAEITLEYNPTGNRADYLRELRAAGVNRLSVGTQSFSDEELRMLGRTHSAAQGMAAVRAAADAGFSNISCDLMLALPGQTKEILRGSIRCLSELPVTHVSAYLLQIEEGTPFSQNAALLSRLPDDDGAAELYLHAVSTLDAAGFRQYEVSSFARSGMRSRHNLKYWQCEPYLGIGAGAHSCFDGKRFCVPRDVAAFIKAPVQPEELIDAQPCMQEERMMLALRTTDGIPENALSASARKQLPMLCKAGYVRQESGRIFLTPEGFAVSNAVIAALIS